MQNLMIGIGGLVAGGGIACLAWLRMLAPTSSRRMARRVEAELRELGLDAPAQPRT